MEKRIDDSSLRVRIVPRVEGAARPIAAERWKILIIDDEEGVHAVTRLVLRNKIILDRGVELLSARSALEARQIMSRTTGIAVILLDIVMEESDSGLTLARWIREELKDGLVRIIVRTGQPGVAPEAEVIEKYEINDYKEKTELTEEKLVSTVVTAVRGYRDLKIIAASRKGMEMVLRAAPTLYDLGSVKLFASGVLTQLIALLSSMENAVFYQISGFAAEVEGESIEVLAGTGKYLPDEGSDNEIKLREEALLLSTAVRDGFTFADGRLTFRIAGSKNESRLFVLDDCPPLSDIDLSLVELYCVNVSTAFSNIRLYETIEQSLSEKVALLHEIHHRVKNNLQIISSLIALGERTSGMSSEDVLEATKKRIMAMKIIHDHVFVNESGEYVDFTECVSFIAQDAISQSPGEDFIITCGGTVLLPLDKAVPCALVIEEMASLAQAAGARRTGDEKRRIVIKLESTDAFRIAMSGNFPPDETSMVSLEADILKALAAQLAGTFRLEAAAEELLCELTFPSAL